MNDKKGSGEARLAEEKRKLVDIGLATSISDLVCSDLQHFYSDRRLHYLKIMAEVFE